MCDQGELLGNSSFKLRDIMPPDDEDVQEDVELVLNPTAQLNPFTEQEVSNPF